MPQIFQGIATTFPSGGPAEGSTTAGIGDMLKLGTGGLGMISNIMMAMRQKAISDQMMNQLKLLQMYQSNPSMLAAKAKSLQAPLSMGLLENVGQGVQAQLAQRGLSSSPAQAQAVMSQTLAPYEQRSQEDAMNAFLQLLGMPLQAGQVASGTLPKPADTSALWKMFLPQQQIKPQMSGLVLNASDSGLPAGTMSDIYTQGSNYFTNPQTMDYSGMNAPTGE